MKKTNGRRRTNPHNTTLPDYREEATPERSKQHSKQPPQTWHDAQTSMMHVRFNEAWQGKMQQTILQIKWSSICNELHIDKIPQQLFSSLPFKYSTILNVS